MGCSARSLTFGAKFDREIAVNETKPRAAPDGRPARIFGRQSRFRRASSQRRGGRDTNKISRSHLNWSGRGGQFGENAAVPVLY